MEVAYLYLYKRPSVIDVNVYSSGFPLISLVTSLLEQLYLSRAQRRIVH